MADRASIAARLAERIAAFGAADFTPKALARARVAVIDTVGVTLAGMVEEGPRLLLDLPGVAPAGGPALVFGTDRRTSTLDAALVNGTASHTLDFDDFCAVLGGHQSVPLVPALFAEAEARGKSGRDLLSAYVVGVETENRIARAVNFHHYDKGWHPTATLGIFGAAAAVSSLIGLDAARTATALAIAASCAAGLKANFGTMTKPLHVGQCTRNGLFAALLAERGFTANPGVFEHHQGFLEVFNGTGTYEVERMFDHWADPLEVEDDSIALKQFPCCGSTHPAIMMALALRAEEHPALDQITRIEVLPHGRRLRHTDTPRPQTALQAKFSVQYVVARALCDGVVRLKDFEDGAWEEPRIARLLGLTEARPHPDMADDAAEQWGAEVILHMADGRKLSRRVNQLVGRDGSHPMTEGELFDKFEDCARRCLPSDRIAPLFERLETLDSAADLGSVTRLMERRGAVAAARGPKPSGFAPAGADAAPETTWVP